MGIHEPYMYRCLELAARGSGQVAPNPLVGSVLVYQGRIIGEGWHQQYGHAHAEVNCLNSVKPEDRHRIPESVLYVSLEPCAHYGKTPPCSSLIIQSGIRNVVVGCLDPFPAVSGKGISLLQAAGIDVVTDVLKEKCRWVNRRFVTVQEKKRPYVVLKWAQTKNGLIGSGNEKRLLISNTFTNKMVHTWRSEEAAILIGANTAQYDNPLLTSRWGKQHQPKRVVVDRRLRLPMDLRLFEEQISDVYILNEVIEKTVEGIHWVLLDSSKKGADAILDALYRLNVQSVLIEGGREMLQLFIDEELWDEARVITGLQKTADAGVLAPELQVHNMQHSMLLSTDKIDYMTHYHS